LNRNAAGSMPRYEAHYTRFEHVPR